MPRYFFHVTGSFEAQDEDGEEFPNADAATAEANSVAGELEQERGRYQGCFVRVTDDNGNEVAKIAMRQVQDTDGF